MTSICLPTTLYHSGLSTESRAVQEDGFRTFVYGPRPPQVKVLPPRLDLYGIGDEVELGLGRIAVSEIEVPILLVNRV